MKKYINSILVIFVLSLMVIGCFQDSGTITGKVTDSDNNPVSGAIVVMEPTGYAATTDENGEYRIEEVPFGDYTVTATSGSYSNSVEVSVVNESFTGCVPSNMFEPIVIKADDIQLDTGTPGSSTFTLTTNVEPVDAGIINLDPPGGSYEAGTEVTLTAIASPGYLFSDWSGEASGISNPTIITVSTNVTVTANFSVDSNLVGYYKFDENSGTTANDSAGTNHGTIDGATWTTGKVNYALSFDGVDDYVYDGTTLNVGDDFTLEAWIYPLDFNGRMRIVNKGLSWHIYGSYALNLSTGGKLELCISDGNEPSWPGVTGNTVLETGKWHYVVGTSQKVGGNLELKVYSDGNLDNAETITRFPQSSTGRVEIGADYRSSLGYTIGNFEGIIDEVAIYNRTLTTEEISLRSQR